MPNEKAGGQCPRNQGSNSDTSIVPHFMLLSSLIFEDDLFIKRFFLNVVVSFSKASTKISEHDVGKYVKK